MNLSAFISFMEMGGYGGYVWSAYGLTLVVLVGSYCYAYLRFRTSLHLASLRTQEKSSTTARTIIFNKKGSL